ncbi:MAG: site-specific integrase [Nitrososphaerales archaeon]
MEKNELLERFNKQMLMSKRSESTIKRSLYVVSDFIKNEGEGPYNKNHVIDYLSKLSDKGFTGNYLRMCYYVLKTFYKSLGLKWEFEKSDVPKANEPFVDYYTIDEVNRMLEITNPDVEPFMLKNHLMVRLLWLLGLRKEQLVSIKWPDIDLEKGKIVIYGIKGSGNRVADLDKRTIELLKRIPDKNGYLFKGRVKNEPINGQSVNYIIKRLCKIAGIKYKGVHAFRRGIVTELYKRGMKEADLKELLRWKTPTMVFRYIRLSSSEVEEKAKELHPLFKG